jgi:5'-methylthioadenosine phosphorylase
MGKATEVRVAKAIIAGSGFYEMAGLEDGEALELDTPFGAPSDPIVVGRLGDERVAFLARHGAGHRLLPSEINHRANIFALKTLGVERIFSASAVGSMRETMRPRDLVVVDQFVDRTFHRPATFFGEGIAAHVALADPVCPECRRILVAAAEASGARVHDGGTYVCIEGPAFSTRAESQLYRSWGMDVIGMTNLQEAKLSREAEICYATLALVTDYDCWHVEEEDVSVEGVLDNLRANRRAAATVLRAAVRRIPRRGGGCACGEALRDAIITSRTAIPEAARERLGPLVERYLDPPP